MSKQAEELQKRITQLSDDQLLEMVTVNSGDYVEQALNYAKAELMTRGIDIAKASAKEVEPGDEPTATPFDTTGMTCFRCGGQMRAGTLVAEKELTVIFTDNREERFIKVNACRQCGQLSLVADYQTDVQA